MSKTREIAPPVKPWEKEADVVAEDDDDEEEPESVSAGRVASC
jgi:hypothetical protein